MRRPSKRTWPGGRAGSWRTRARWWPPPALGLGREPTYDTIYQGAWGTEAPEYAFLHRIAVSGACKGKGAPSWFFQELERQARERGLPCLRGDTHRENKIMQRVMEKNGLSCRGVIYLEDGGERLAFEKLL